MQRFNLHGSSDAAKRSSAERPREDGETGREADRERKRDRDRQADRDRQPH